MKFNFDEPIDRKDTLSIKYDFHRERMPENVIPLWVADMDFGLSLPLLRHWRRLFSTVSMVIPLQRRIL